MTDPKPLSTEGAPKPDLQTEMWRGLNCLYLEAPNAVVDDVIARVRAAFADAEQQAADLKRKYEEICIERITLLAKLGEAKLWAAEARRAAIEECAAICRKVADDHYSAWAEVCETRIRALADQVKP